jgi:hypothetical protein
MKQLLSIINLIKGLFGAGTVAEKAVQVAQLENEVKEGIAELTEKPKKPRKKRKPRAKKVVEE